MTAPYDAGAPLYLQGGLWPIPVMGKNTPVKGATGYEGTVTVEKVAAWLTTDMHDRAVAGRGVRVDNIAIRHQGTLAIDVDEGYGDKDGVKQLAAFAEKAGLPPLPPTWSSTARGPETGSRQYVYRIPEDARLKTKPCPSVELCCWHHRFTVCWPSIHPATGDVYTWYLPGEPGVPPTWGEATDRVPVLSELPMLPSEWFRAFRGSVANADRTVATVGAPELLATFPQGAPDGLVRHLIEQWSDEGQHVGHDEAKNALINAFMLGREGHPGVVELYELLVGRFTSYLSVARPEEAEFEAQSLIAACADIAQQKPIVPVVVGRMPTPAEFMAGATVAPVEAPVEDVVDEDTWSAFIATFTTDARPGMAFNRARWLRNALLEAPRLRARTFRHHAVKAFEEAVAGHYSAQSAADFLADLAPIEVGDIKTELRACLSAALTKLEGAGR